MPKLSVIIPVYGVENYIERCARSLFDQRLDDVEFIFIDDCTLDNSMGVLDTVINEYRQRISEMNWIVRTVRLPENCGLPSVRKRGVQLATGDYLIHCDSDDWVEKEMYESLYRRAVEEDADMVVCDYYLSGKEGENKRVKACHSTQKDRFMEDLLLQKTPWPLWNKMVRRSIYKDVAVYPSYSMGEDLVLCVQLATLSPKIAYLEAPLYHYMFNPSSITKVKTEESIYNKYLQLKENTDIVLSYLEQVRGAHNLNNILTFLKDNAISTLGPITGKKEYYDLWRNAYPGTVRTYLTMPNVSFSSRLLCFMTLLRLYPFRIDRVI